MLNKRLETYWLNEVIKTSPYYFKPFTIECLEKDTYIALVGLADYVGVEFEKFGGPESKLNPFPIDKGGIRIQFSKDDWSSDWLWLDDGLDDNLERKKAYYGGTPLYFSSEGNITLKDGSFVYCPVSSALPKGMKVSIIFDPVEIEVFVSKQSYDQNTTIEIPKDGNFDDFFSGEPVSTKLPLLAWREWTTSYELNESKYGFGHSIIVWDGTEIADLDAGDYEKKPFNVEGNIMSLMHGENFVGQNTFFPQSLNISRSQYEVISTEESNGSITYKSKQTGRTTGDYIDLFQDAVFKDIIIDDEFISDKRLFIKMPKNAESEPDKYSWLGLLILSPSGDFDDSGQDGLDISKKCGFFSRFLRNQSVEQANNLLLPAEILVDGCYCAMFQNCTELKSIPKIASAHITRSCYAYMFDGCKSLNPDCLYIPKPISVEEYWLKYGSRISDYMSDGNDNHYFPYYKMFQNCTSLNKVEAHMTENKHIAEVMRGSYISIFPGCSGIEELNVITPDEEWELFEHSYGLGNGYTDTYYKVGDIVDNGRLKIYPDTSGTVNRDIEHVFVDFLNNKLPEHGWTTGYGSDVRRTSQCNLDTFIKQAYTDEKSARGYGYLYKEGEQVSWEWTGDMFFGPWVEQETEGDNCIDFERNKKIHYYHPNDFYVQQPLTFRVLQTCEFEWGELNPVTLEKDSNPDELWGNIYSQYYSDFDYDLLYNRNLKLVKTYLTSLEYSMDGGDWMPYKHKITIPGGHSVSWRIKDNIPTFYGNDGEKYKFNNDGVTEYRNIPKMDFKPRFKIFENLNGQFEACGNIMSIVDPEYDKENKLTTIPYPYCFTGFFKGNSSLISARQLCLPATTLQAFCYAYMFDGCTNLTHPPYVLPAFYGSRYPTTSEIENVKSLIIGDFGDYAGMFRNCKNLLDAPIMRLSSIKVAKGRTYKKNWYTLKDEDEYWETEQHPFLDTLLSDGSMDDNKEKYNWLLYGNICHQMFYGCTSLILCPFLNLYKDVEFESNSTSSSKLKEMFRNCSNLKYAKIWSTGLAESSSTKVFPDSIASDNSVLLVGPYSRSEWYYSCGDTDSGSGSYRSVDCYSAAVEHKIYEDGYMINDSSQEMSVPIIMSSDGSNATKYFPLHNVEDSYYVEANRKLTTPYKYDEYNKDKHYYKIKNHLRLGQNFQFGEKNIAVAKGKEEVQVGRPPLKPYFPDVFFSFVSYHYVAKKDGKEYTFYYPVNENDNQLNSLNYVYSSKYLCNFNVYVYGYCIYPNSDALNYLGGSKNFKYKYCFNTNPMIVSWDKLVDSTDLTPAERVKEAKDKDLINFGEGMYWESTTEGNISTSLQYIDWEGYTLDYSKTKNATDGRVYAKKYRPWAKEELSDSLWDIHRWWEKDENGYYMVPLTTNYRDTRRDPFTKEFIKWFDKNDLPNSYKDEYFAKDDIQNSIKYDSGQNIEFPTISDSELVHFTIKWKGLPNGSINCVVPNGMNWLQWLHTDFAKEFRKEFHYWLPQEGADPEDKRNNFWDGWPENNSGTEAWPDQPISKQVCLEGQPFYPVYANINDLVEGTYNFFNDDEELDTEKTYKYEYKYYICKYPGLPCHMLQVIQNNQTYVISNREMVRWDNYDLGTL